MAKTTAARPEVKPLDFLDIDHLLLDEERMVGDTVRKFVRDRVLPGIEDWFEAGHFPKELAPEIGKLGLLGMHLHGSGCPGASATSDSAACPALAAGDGGSRPFVPVQGARATFPSWKAGREERTRGGRPRGGRRTLGGAAGGAWRGKGQINFHRLCWPGGASCEAGGRGSV